MKILLIEDENELAASIITFLKKEGFLCELAVNFSEAMEKSQIYQYDAILLDIGLPGGSGLNVLAALKETKSKAAVLIISAKNSLDDKVYGLDLGADDYLVKPFHLVELKSRLNAVLRRKNFGGEESIVFGDLLLFPKSFSAFVKEQALNLTKKEFDLLLFLVMNKELVLSKEMIAEHLWGDHIDSSDSFDFVYTHIKNLRKKIIDAGCKDYMKTIYGLGYKFTLK